MTDQTSGLLFALALDGEGSARHVEPQATDLWSDNKAAVWLHMDINQPDTTQWLRESSGLTVATVEALLADETRPRCFQGKRGLVAVLRGINLNPGKTTSDMLDLRMWSDGARLLTLRTDRVQTVRDLEDELIGKDTGPLSISELFTRIISRLNERIEPSIEAIDAQITELADAADNDGGMRSTDQLIRHREALHNLRTNVTILRRYLAPQRSVLSELQHAPPTWADRLWPVRLRESTDLVMRMVEELDMAREHIIAAREDVAARRAEAMNQTMYVLAIISAIFLPISFLTGLFGVNIGGMPGVNSPLAFSLFCFALLFFAVIQVLLFRRYRWL